MKIIKINFLKAILLCAGFSFLMTSCTKDDDPSPDPTPNTTNTITDVVVAGDDFSTLESAVIKANLQATLSGTGPFTVFAPNNAAFAASGIDQTTLDGLTEAEVANILLYHTISSEIMAADVPAGPNASVTTASGDSVFVTSNTNGVFINGIPVSTADVAADNGVIHVIDRVLTAPTGNTVETAVASGFDSLVKAVTRATNEMGGYPQLTNILSTSTVTVFAPTNDAFSQLLVNLNLTDINDIPMTTLLAVLQYHVVNGRAFSSDLSNGSQAMLAGSTTVDLTGTTPTIEGTGNGGTASNISATNIMTRNGVIHVIDRVLVP